MSTNNKIVHGGVIAQLERVNKLFDVVLPQINYGASVLDADAIRLLNEVPGEVRRILKEHSCGGNNA